MGIRGTLGGCGARIYAERFGKLFGTFLEFWRFPEVLMVPIESSRRDLTIRVLLLLISQAGEGEIMPKLDDSVAETLVFPSVVKSRFRYINISRFEKFEL